MRSSDAPFWVGYFAGRGTLEKTFFLAATYGTGENHLIVNK